ncbi:unnamed protein product [Caenorhabditis bovis]|uniref:phosphatidylinositol-3,4,5-trisphosphate 3-phosphatase n=1 Tax=Caenorhabditis bovis TaxID=2654633 RepID=A0A8S1EZ71_9PELO|nr:unnamed protein product [Caenorhabditis bovis]
MPKEKPVAAGSEPCTSNMSKMPRNSNLHSRTGRHRKQSSSTSSEASGDEEPKQEMAVRRRERSDRDGPLEGLKEMVCSKFRVIVSQNRRRIKTDGFDLDLTYITDRIIAMGYPANATEALYRNSMKHIIRFLEKRHKDHYKVFNLRGQYSYDPANFKNRVVSFEMTDHHPPRLELMAPFCREVHEWLCEDPRNVVAVHCKAGKGRTGVMICAYLSYCCFYPSPRQNMDYYSVVRTRNNKGVTIPSQRRYVYYYDHLRKHKLNYLPCRMQLVGIYLERPPKSRGPLMRDQLSMRVANGDVDVYYGQPMNIADDVWAEEETAWAGHVVSKGFDSYDPNCPVPNEDVISRRAYGWTVPSTQPVFLEGDVRVDLYVHKKFINIFTSTGRNKLGHIWFNTMFSCPGACGGDPYVHGDEAHPYPEGETTIAARKKQFTIGDDEVYSSNVNRESEDTFDEPLKQKQSQVDSLQSCDIADINPLPLVARSGQSKSSPLLSPERSPATSVGAMSSPSMSSAATLTPKSKERKDAARKSTSRLSKASKAAKRIFTSSEGAKSRASEPAINVSAVSPSHRRSTPEAVYSSTVPSRPPLNFDELQISEPPGLNRHCPEESLDRIYREKGRIPPRYAISKMLVEAHEKELVQDVYNERRRSVPSEGEPVKCAPEGKPNASGPNRLLRNFDEHVSVFPIMEIDRACKNDSIQTGFKDFDALKLESEGVATNASNEFGLLDDTDVDNEVRSYHPDPGSNWDNSASSRSSSSSEDVQIQPNSSMITTDYSGIDSSVNEATGNVVDQASNDN